MSSSFTTSQSTTFTITHAKHLAAKVATDLKRIQRFYGRPSDADIAAYETELIELLKAGYLGKVSYGFRRNGLSIEPTLIYTAQELGVEGAVNDDPGRVRPNADTTGATFGSYLTLSPAWWTLSQSERDAFEEKLPFKRSGAEEPGVNGYLDLDRSYSAGGRSLQRASVRASA